MRSGGARSAFLVRAVCLSSAKGIILIKMGNSPDALLIQLFSRFASASDAVCTIKTAIDRRIRFRTDSRLCSGFGTVIGNGNRETFTHTFQMMRTDKHATAHSRRHAAHPGGGEYIFSPPSLVGKTATEFRL